MATTIITFGVDGTARALATGETAWMAAEGDARRRRASHVLPERFFQRQAFRLLRAALGDEGLAAGWTRRWRCRWLADLAPSGGPRLGPFCDRAKAIRAEIEWLRAHKAL